MLPVIVSQIIVIVKDSALGAIIFYPELLTQARQMGSAGQRSAGILFVAVIFILINYALSKLAEAVENRQRRRAAGAIKKGKKDDDEGNMAGSAINIVPSQG